MKRNKKIKIKYPLVFASAKAARAYLDSIYIKAASSNRATFTIKFRYLYKKGGEGKEKMKWASIVYRAKKITKPSHVSGDK